MKVAQSCPTLCDSVDYTVHGILQARILEWVAFPFSRGSSQPRDWTRISGRFFTSWATREAQYRPVTVTLKGGRCPLQITKPHNKQFKKDHCEHTGRRKSEESQPKGSICPAPHPNQGVAGNEEGADNNGATRGPSPHDTGYAQHTATRWLTSKSLKPGLLSMQSPNPFQAIYKAGLCHMSRGSQVWFWYLSFLFVFSCIYSTSKFKMRRKVFLYQTI